MSSSSSAHEQERSRQLAARGVIDTITYLAVETKSKTSALTKRCLAQLADVSVVWLIDKATVVSWLACALAKGRLHHVDRGCVGYVWLAHGSFGMVELMQDVSVSARRCRRMRNWTAYALTNTRVATVTPPTRCLYSS